MIIWTRPRITNPAPRAAHPLPGAGALVTATSLGFLFSGAARGQTFNHPFRPLVGPKSLTFVVGSVRSVNGIGPIEPTIKVGGDQVPMSGKTGNSPTPLPLDADMQNDQGESWVVLEVSPDPKTGELLQGALCQLMHSSDAGPAFSIPGVESTGVDPNLGRQPITQILWQGKQMLQALPVVHFNFVYTRVQPGPGGGPVKHFFT